MTYLESLRRNEAEHRARLEAWLRDHGQDPEADADADAGPKAHADAGPETHAPAGEGLDATLLDRAAAGRHPLARKGGGRGHAGDLAALRSDYDLEDEAVVVYGHFAYQAEDRELIELFKELARSESGHRNGLRRTIRTVEDPATPVLLFCPLCGWQIDFGPDPAEGAEGKCAMCPRRFALRLGEDGDWTLERLAP